MTVFEHIVVGVDGRAGGRDALALAAMLQSVCGGDVTAVNAYPYDRTVSIDHAEQVEATLLTDLLAKLEAELARAGVTARALVVADPSPAHALQAVAERDGADLIVVGAPHRAGGDRLLGGDVAASTLHGAPCAVAVAPHGYRIGAGAPMEDVGAAWDSSPESRAALAAAIGAATAFDAHLEIITVVTTELYGAPALVTGPGWVTVRDDVEREIRRDLDEIVAATAELVATEGVLLHGRPWTELASRSEELDLLFIGSRGYGPAHSVLAGGTSGALMQHAHCPVIVLPRDVDTPVVDIFEATATPA